jgi:hypothetical protein
MAIIVRSEARWNALPIGEKASSEITGLPEVLPPARGFQSAEVHDYRPQGRLATILKHKHSLCLRPTGTELFYPNAGEECGALQSSSKAAPGEAAKLGFCAV